MEIRVFGNLATDGLEVVERMGKYFVRYDAGAHQVAWREDEVSAAELDRIRAGRGGEYAVILDVKRRARMIGNDPNTQNWTPETE